MIVYILDYKNPDIPFRTVRKIEGKDINQIKKEADRVLVDTLSCEFLSDWIPLPGYAHVYVRRYKPWDGFPYVASMFSASEWKAPMTMKKLSGFVRKVVDDVYAKTPIPWGTP